MAAEVPVPAIPPPRLVQYGEVVSTRLQDKLRDCQKKALDSLVSWFQDPNTTGSITVVVMPTWSGKTGVICSLPYWFGDAFQKGKIKIDLNQPILVIAPGLELLRQLEYNFKQNENRLAPCFLLKVEAVKDTVQELRHFLYRVGITSTTAYVANLRNNQDDVVLTNAQKWRSHQEEGFTWHRLPSDLFSVVVVDEAHHLPSEQWQRIIDKFKPHAKVVFLTATPYRADKKLIAVVDRYAYHLPDEEVVHQGIIRPVKFTENLLRFGDVEERFAYTPNHSNHQLYRGMVIDKVIECIEQEGYLPGGHPHCAMLICRDTDEADAVQILCREKRPELKISCVHSRMPKQRLDKVMKSIEDKSLRIVIIVQKLLEGFDYPCVSVAGILTCIRSPLKFAQFIGRARRVIPDEGNVDADIITHEYFQQEELFQKFVGGHLIPIKDFDED